MDGEELKKLASNIFAQSEFRNGVFRAAEGCEYSLDDFDTKLNNNVLIVGGSGTGKTRKIVTPNIKEAVGSYFICDPKGQLYKVWGKYLVDNRFHPPRYVGRLQPNGLP